MKGEASAEARVITSAARQRFFREHGDQISGFPHHQQEEEEEEISGFVKSAISWL
jgi:hypothetical protein